jgi:hypothetical protein
MMILKYSDTEYLIHYPIGKNGLYFRGYAIVIGGVSCVQLQVIGADDGPPKEGEKDLFHVVAYQVMHGKLEVRILNSDLIDDNLKVAETLEAFLHYRDHKELFTGPGSFRRIDG